ncbi:LpxL/LpxP family Kdo(2)-lipid IV(A) lauroyl/palmitoleoyl acyltransferase [Motiliproteus coralliicola]|uniref:Lipid A biosynthesis acyltransferase n=1 Tax=Motiliproteus coralliicola TaxID=2283196 RepID=A0A369WH28_9GAMM|nr:LpxL/LpxP family Kdo(2)-lipid IV(A) lauroyl/palmitoleoyl acyltransferase [Motiliproteus coralliicola]RDE18755.1 LpxL/LpxP family Kdo(2)-lipid IV(A) lauroyl/palmitoleoyl acyltransferase [Motiliproteus coralliicola]
MGRRWTRERRIKNPTLKNLLGPRFWLLWLGLGLLRLLIMLPFPIQLAIGRVAGRLLYHLAPKRVSVARRNIEHCFPEQSAKQHEQLTRQHFEALGIALFETGLSWWGSDRKIAPLLREINGLEHLQAAQAEGKGVILLCAHFTDLEIASRMLLPHASFAAVYRQMNNPLLEYVTAAGRNLHTEEAIPKDNIKRMIKLLRSGRTIWFASDQSYKKKNSALIDFFGQPARTATVVPMISRAGKALVIPFNIARVGNGYRIDILAPWDRYPSGDDIADTRRYNQVIEEQIKQVPEQYLWAHKRFKGTPGFKY